MNRRYSNIDFDDNTSSCNSIYCITIHPDDNYSDDNDRNDASTSINNDFLSNSRNNNIRLNDDSCIKIEIIQTKNNRYYCSTDDLSHNSKDEDSSTMTYPIEFYNIMAEEEGDEDGGMMILPTKTGPSVLSLGYDNTDNNLMDRIHYFLDHLTSLEDKSQQQEQHDDENTISSSSSSSSSGIMNSRIRSRSNSMEFIERRVSRSQVVTSSPRRRQQQQRRRSYGNNTYDFTFNDDDADTISYTSVGSCSYVTTDDGNTNNSVYHIELFPSSSNHEVRIPDEGDPYEADIPVDTNDYDSETLMNVPTDPSSTQQSEKTRHTRNLSIHTSTATCHDWSNPDTTAITTLRTAIEQQCTTSSLGNTVIRPKSMHLPSPPSPFEPIIDRPSNGASIPTSSPSVAYQSSAYGNDISNELLLQCQQQQMNLQRHNDDHRHQQKQRQMRPGVYSNNTNPITIGTQLISYPIGAANSNLDRCKKCFNGEVQDDTMSTESSSSSSSDSCDLKEVNDNVEYNNQGGNHTSSTSLFANRYNKSSYYAVEKGDRNVSTSSGVGAFCGTTVITVPPFQRQTSKYRIASSDINNYNIENKFCEGDIRTKDGCTNHQPDSIDVRNDDRKYTNRKCIYVILCIAAVCVLVTICIVFLVTICRNGQIRTEDDSKSSNTATTLILSSSPVGLVSSLAPTLSPMIVVSPVALTEVTTSQPSTKVPTATPTSAPTTIVAPSKYAAFQTHDELRNAVDMYLSGSIDIKNMYGPIEYWDVSAITNFTELFAGYRSTSLATFDADLSAWNVSSATTMQRMFAVATSFTSDLSHWDVSKVVDFSYMFNGATIFNSDLSQWNVSSAQIMTSMFDGATQFTSDLSLWDVRSAIQISAMFANTKQFTSDLSQWDTRSVRDVSFMFNTAENFHSNLSSWNTSQIVFFDGMFEGATKFNGDLSRWDTSKATSIAAMFASAESFEGTSISSWDVSNVIYMEMVFAGALSFDANLSSWDVSNVKSMINMFSDTESFRGIGIETWNTSSVTAFASMFTQATSFNGNLTPWDISKANDMSEMFKSTKLFQGNGLQRWKINSNAVVSEMFCSATGFNKSEITNWNISLTAFDCNQ